MKVRCVKIINPVTLKIETESHWVRIGQEYTVLEILGRPGGRISLRIHQGDEPPGVWHSEMFESTDSTVPSNWVAQVSDGGMLSLGPEPWLERGFWESYFDDEPEAVAAFEAARAVILHESSRA